jgi:hypothetical protein
MKKWMKSVLVLLSLLSSHVAWSDDNTWFSVFNVSMKDVPNNYYAYRILGPSGGTCTSTCSLVPFQESIDGTTNVPLSCQPTTNCPTTLTILLKGQVAGNSCQNIDLTGISEVWVHYNEDHITANCQAYYLSAAVQAQVAAQLAAAAQPAPATTPDGTTPAAAPGVAPAAAPAPVAPAPVPVPAPAQ